jgi:hypothetical protein
MRNQIGLLKAAAINSPQPVGKYAPAAGYKYQKTAEGLNNPYASQVPIVAQPPPDSLTKSVGMTVGEIAADSTLGSQAITGIPWFAGKAIYHGATGQWGKAALDVGMGVASLVPGANTVAGVVRAGNAAARVGRLAGAANKYKNAITTTQNAIRPVANAVRAAPAVTKVNRAVDYVSAPIGRMVRGAAPSAGSGRISNTLHNVRGAAAAGGGSLLRNSPAEYAVGKFDDASSLLPAPPPMFASDNFSGNYR